MELVSLLCFLEPSVLRSHPETFEWVRATLKCVHRDGVDSNETAWSAGLRAWNELWEAQEVWEAYWVLRGGCDAAETRDAKKLEAMLKLSVPGVRGCFARLSAVTTTINQLWLSRVGWGCEIFPAVYH